ncbi:MAG: MlaC/ttg2D family ABC transporter substrate-binding protein [Phycisphaerae bacterium]
MKSFTLPKALALAALLLASPLARAADPAPAPDDASLAPRPLIEKLVTQLLAILRDPKLSKPERRQQVRDLAYAHMDFPTLSRLTLGRHWRELNDDQKKRFMEEYRTHLTATYGHTSDEYTDEDIKVLGDRTEQNGDAIVSTSIIGSQNGGPRKEIAKVEYRLRKSPDGAWKIIDFNIDGVSLVTNFRSQFQEIIANGGIDHLIQLLHEKNASAK